MKIGSVDKKREKRRWRGYLPLALGETHLSSLVQGKGGGLV